MDYGTPEMIEINRVDAVLAEDGNHASVVCHLPRGGSVRLKMDRAVLELLSRQAAEELRRHPARRS
jgi:hypothetical protein